MGHPSWCSIVRLIKVGGRSFRNRQLLDTVEKKVPETFIAHSTLSTRPIITTDNILISVTVTPDKKCCKDSIFYIRLAFPDMIILSRCLTNPFRTTRKCFDPRTIFLAPILSSCVNLSTSVSLLFRRDIRSTFIASALVQLYVSTTCLSLPCNQRPQASFLFAVFVRLNPWFLIRRCYAVTPESHIASEDGHPYDAL